MQHSQVIGQVIGRVIGTIARNGITIAGLGLVLWLLNHSSLMLSSDADFDEGINLMKALLYDQGFPLYRSVWNDQPPLFTVLLAKLFHVFGHSVIAARSLVLGFSAVLLWVLFRLVRDAVGWPGAIAATMILITSWQFGNLSTAVMIGLPSLSLAMVSILLVRCYHQSSHRYWLVFSGVIFALSVQTKLFTGFLFPLIILEIVEFQFHSIWARLRPCLIWLVSCVLVFGAIAIGFQQFSSGQMVLGHLAQPYQEDWFDNVSFLRYMLRENAAYVLLALVGIITILHTHDRSGRLAIAWFAGVIVILANQKPLWYHHFMLIAIPMSWLGGYGVTAILSCFQVGGRSRLRTFPWRRWVGAIGIGLGAWIYAVSAISPYPLVSLPPPQNPEIVQRLVTYRPKTKWILCDRPFYAFQAGLKVPPELAVMSFKRLKSGQLTLPQVFNILQTYRPEQLALLRWTKILADDSDIWNYIQTHYTQTYTSADGLEQHYLRQDLVRLARITIPSSN